LVYLGSLSQLRYLVLTFVPPPPPLSVDCLNSVSLQVKLTIFLVEIIPFLPFGKYLKSPITYELLDSFDIPFDFANSTTQGKLSQDDDVVFPPPPEPPQYVVFLAQDKSQTYSL
jgi:hypothetical protein